MPNTKEVEQAAERKTLDMLFEHFVDHKNIDGPVTDEYIKQEYEEEFNLAMDLAIFGYDYALSNPLEQSEKKEGYEQLKKAFEDLLMQYSPKNKICRNAWMITAGLKSELPSPM